MFPPIAATPSRWLHLQDLTLIIGVLLISKFLLLQIDAIWIYAGPISLLMTLCVATICLKQRQENWTSIGLRRPQSIKKLALFTLIALVVTIGVGVLANSLFTSLLGVATEETQAIDAQFQGRFDNLPGNLPVLLFWLSIAWIIGGFTEEMLFRGALFTRFEGLFANVPFAVFLAIMCQSLLFGQGHFYYQGMAGLATNSAIGFVSGVLYLLFKRNLWPIILSHGLSNTLGLTLLYLGGMQ